MPTERNVTSVAPSVSAITRHTAYTPDYTDCRETQQVVEASSTLYKVTTGFGYDTFGNMSSQTVTGVGMTARTSSINWGTSGQFPATATNALGQVAHLAYNASYGTPSSMTDPNGLVTSWLYDTFGRKTQETRADGTYTKWTYYDCVNFGGCLVGPHAVSLNSAIYNTDGSLLTTSTAYYDPLDRQLMTYTTLLTGAYQRKELRYDNLGRVAKQSMPCIGGSLTTTCTYWTTYSHDVFGRVTQSQRPISASNSSPETTTYAYQGRTTTTTDPQGKVTTSITKVNGRPGRTQDHNGYYLNFNEDAVGSVVSVTDSLSNTLRSVTYAYGIKPFATTVVDMDLGTKSNTYDALGEITARSDSKGQTFSAAYDALSRPLTRTEAEGVTTWTWGASATSHNIGQLQSVSSPGYGETEAYDTHGRLMTRTITSDATYSYDYTYNSLSGLLDTLSYPTSTSGYRLKLQYGYGAGILKSIQDASSSTVYWQANAANGWGEITQETLGNGVVTNRAYDAVTSWLSSIQSGVSSGSGIQNESYLFDLVGNVTQRQNNNVGLTENFYYDNLYRLDHSTLGGTTNLQIAYDAMGDITSRSDVAGGATWTYDSARKHAVLQAGSAANTYTYDANGNANTRNGYSISWTTYDYPSSIDGNNKNIALYYDANRQRYKQVYSSDGTLETTIYVGGMLEKVTLGGSVDWRHYIRAGRELVAIVSRQSSGTNAVHYALTDHESSIASWLDAAGAISVAESFSAFGTRRDPTNWSTVPTCPDLCSIKAISREGYTGQDAIGGVSMGLNDMNGRVQDAITGRFLSADPRGQTRSNTQSWNRYSYVNNNPLSFIDPSGFDEMNLNQMNEDSAEELDEIKVTADRPNSDTSSNFAVDGSTGGKGGESSGAGGDGGGTLDPVVVQCTINCGPDHVKTQISTPLLTLLFGPPAGFGKDGGDKLAQSPNPITPCPNGLAADVAYGLFQMGKNAATAGKAAVALGTGIAAIAAPASSTPPGLAAEGVAGTLVAAGGMTALTGYTMQLGGAAFLAFQGDPGPLDSVLASTLNLNVPFVPSITPTNPFSSNFSSQAGASTCHQ